jgi:DNA-binding transcriptional ArsR family regulator
VTARAGDAGERLLKAIAHPLRHRILVAINERESSPNEIAQRLGEPLGRVSHHVRVLTRLGAIELVRTEPRRGAVEHFYRARIKPWFDDDAWSQLPLSARRTLFGQNLQRLMGDVAKAAREGGFDHLQAHVSYTELELDDEAMAAISALLTDTLDRMLEIQEAAAQRVGDGSAPLRTELGIVHFERR